jgi:hypothetical protein
LIGFFAIGDGEETGPDRLPGGNVASGWTGLTASSGLARSPSRPATWTASRTPGGPRLDQPEQASRERHVHPPAALMRAQRQLGDRRHRHARVHGGLAGRCTTRPAWPSAGARRLKIVTSEHERFSADQIVVKCTLRAAFGVPDENGVVKMTGLPQPRIDVQVGRRLSGAAPSSLPRRRRSPADYIRPSSSTFLCSNSSCDRTPLVTSSASCAICDGTLVVSCADSAGRVPRNFAVMP